ncbi:endonuclease/exonuclease/phosphatase family protein [Leeuwenhoekiella sp. W20_SRS_FM14]|uniref:endonuclease/exonuclease/phosphatase family protein n=1 Tax=Leeuwenhoekiella sp. W20_SRS_FM14 TaxID=3240270 RepID=UPI003F97619C
MKKLGLWNKIVFFINSLFAIALLIGYALPYFPPKIFPPVSVLTLIIPVLLAINALFVIYWLVLFKRQFLLSGSILVWWLFIGTSLFNFGSGVKINEIVKAENQLSFFSYNVHVFSSENYTRNEIKKGLNALIEKNAPDIMTFQEFSKNRDPEFKGYPYSYFGENGTRNYGQKIYSKYPIVNKGSLNFTSTFNNAIFVDIVKAKDTIRIYNMHMQTLTLTPELNALEQENTKSLVGRLGRAFKKQQEQTNLFLEHQRSCSYKTIVAGDFNNTAFSYTYNKIRGSRLDAFEEKGSGFGRTFIFDIIPLRIDFILPDTSFEVLAFENFNVNYSDHFPIMAVLQL